jgi:hypothetical protein
VDGCVECLATALIRSLQPGETWSWCFVDEVGLLVRDIRGQTRIRPSPLGGTPDHE